MKHIYFTAGPSQIHPSIPHYVQMAMEEEILCMSHRGEAFQKMFIDTRLSLKKLLNIPEENHIFFIASANEAWEKIIENTVQKHSYHLVNGAFGKRFFQIAQELKKHPAAAMVADGESFDFSSIKIPKESELVCLTHNESSTGVALNMNHVHELKKRYPEKLFAVDTVSSAPIVDIDYSLMDCVFFSVQKGFGLPAGLGVLILTPAAMEKAQYLEKKDINIGSYHNFPTQLKFALKNQTPETPNVLNIYLFHKIIQEMLQKGIQNIRKETDEKAKLLNEYFETNQNYEFFVKKPENRSNTVVIVKTPESSTLMIKRIKEYGFVLGKGYGPYKDDYVRISNFPSHSLQDVKKLVQYL